MEPLTQASTTFGMPQRSAVWSRIGRSFGTTEIQILVAALVLFTLFSLLYPASFFSTGTFTNMARVAGILLVVSIGQSFALIVGGFDLSVGATMGFVSVVVSLWMVDGGSVAMALAIGCGAGLLIGLVNGILIARLGVTPFVATLGTMTFLLGLADQLANGGSIVGLPRAFSMFGRQNWGGIPSAACIAIGALVVAWAVLQRTRAGLYIFSIGGNAEASRVAGIPIVRYKVLAYTATGLFAGLAGIMVTSRVGVGQTTVGSGYELQSIATAVIGGVAIGGGIGRLSGVLLGVILLTVLTTGLDIAGVNTFFQQMVTGVVLIVAVLFARSQGAIPHAIPHAIGRAFKALGRLRST